jgi:hypothetical protein
MNKDRAGHLGNLAADFFLHNPDHDREYANRVNSAISLHLLYDLPDGECSAVIEHPERVPLVLVASQSMLYAVDIAPHQEVDEDGRLESRCRGFRMDRREMSLEQRALCRSADGGGHSRRHTWHLNLPEFEIEIYGRIAVDGRADEREELAQHIAKQLGWNEAA